jgi:aminopeptidase C
MRSESDHLYIMNSWGDDWADNGFFRIENADVLSQNHNCYFYDVFWYISMLSEYEIEAYNKASLEKFRDLEKNYLKESHATSNVHCASKFQNQLILLEI